MILNKFKLVLTLAVTMFISTSVLASNQGIKITVDGVNLQTDVSPVSLNGRVMVPVRAIFETMGAEVDWDKSTNTVIGIRGNDKIILKLGSPKANINGREITLDTPATIIKGNTLVPVRIIGESFGSDVKWDGKTKTVIIVDKAKPKFDGKEIEAFKNLLNDKKWLNNNSIPKNPGAGEIYEHHFVDLDQDGISEMIVYHGGSRSDTTVSVFTYNKGDFKVQHLDAGQSEYGGYNKSKKTFFIDGMARGFYWTNGYKLVNGRCEEVFRAKCELDTPEEFQTFELNGKKVSKSEYKKYLESYGKDIYN